MCFSSIISFSTYASVGCSLKLYHCCSSMPRRKWVLFICFERGTWKKSSAEGERKIRGERRTDENWLYFYGSLSPMTGRLGVETWWPKEGHLSQGVSQRNTEGFVAIAVNGFICQRLQAPVKHLKVWAGEGVCYLRIVYQQEVFLVVEYYVVCKSALLLAPSSTWKRLQNARCICN